MSFENHDRARIGRTISISISNNKVCRKAQKNSLQWEAVFVVPKADTKPSKKRKTKEDKSIEIEPFAKTAFSLVFFKVYYFC